MVILNGQFIGEVRIRERNRGFGIDIRFKVMGVVFVVGEYVQREK